MGQLDHVEPWNPYPQSMVTECGPVAHVATDFMEATKPLRPLTTPGPIADVWMFILAQKNPYVMCGVQQQPFHIRAPTLFVAQTSVPPVGSIKSFHASWLYPSFF